MYTLFDLGIVILVSVFPNHVYPGLSLECREKILKFQCLVATSSLSTTVLPLLSEKLRIFLPTIYPPLQSHRITYLLLVMLPLLTHILQMFRLLPLYNFEFQSLYFHPYLVYLHDKKIMFLSARHN